METTKIKMTRKEEFEVEIQFPLYRRLPSGQYFYACLNKNDVILVNTNTPEISKSYLEQAYLFPETHDTTKEEFQEAYNSTFAKLNELLNK